MKLFCREEMQRLEKAAERSGVGLSQLMTHAGTALAEEAASRIRPIAGKKIVLLCGSGNNGGDGFVCARVLSERGAKCTVVLTCGEPKTDLAANAFDLIPDEVHCVFSDIDTTAAEQAITQANAVIDCIFGFGFRGNLSGDSLKFISLANRTECLKIAADLPSGVECDSARADENSFLADVTVTFTAAKPANCCYPAKRFCGQTVVRQIGVPSVLTEAAETGIFQLSHDYALSRLPTLSPESNKGTHGTLLMVCGSYGMAGACIMAARAALRCGVGLVKIAVDSRLYPVLAPAIPEAVFIVLDWATRPTESEQKLCAALETSTACVVGCGLGELAETVCPIVFSQCTIPLVADADALNFCARHPETLDDAEMPLILTPHPGEMARLCGDTIAEIQADRLGAAREKARETGAVVVLKGAATVIAAANGACAINPTGNAGMAKGGSGDVLAGITGALAAQGIAPFEAASAAAYIHGLAGDLAAEKYGARSALPTDIIEQLPLCLRP